MWAAREGHLRVLQWVRSGESPCPWDEETCAEAAIHGHLKVLQWARDNGYGTSLIFAIGVYHARRHYCVSCGLYSPMLCLYEPTFKLILRSNTRFVYHRCPCDKDAY